MANFQEDFKQEDATPRMNDNDSMDKTNGLEEVRPASRMMEAEEENIDVGSTKDSENLTETKIEIVEPRSPDNNSQEEIKEEQLDHEENFSNASSALGKKNLLNSGLTQDLFLVSGS